MEKEEWMDYLKPAEWEIIVCAPGNFFLAGEHAVMFGHPAIVQAIPLYVYVGVRKREKDNGVKIDLGNVTFIDAGKPDQKHHSFVIPTRTIGCQLEHALKIAGWEGVDIGLYSGLPSMCGLASSGALGAAISIALNYLIEKTVARCDLDAFLKTVASPTRTISEVKKNPIFSDNIFPLAWWIDTLFHNHQSSGVNAFFSLVGSPDGLPAWYRQTTPRKGDVDTRLDGYNPSRTVSTSKHCSDFRETSDSGIFCCAKEPCPDMAQEFAYYKKFPYEAKSLTEVYSNASCELFNFCCSLIYSGHPKTTKLAIKSVERKIEGVGRYFTQCDWLNLKSNDAGPVIMAYIGAIAVKLWQAMGAYFDSLGSNEASEVIKTIGLAQSALQNFLGVSTDRIDSICRKAKLSGFEAKLTGSGKGGDVVVMCEGDEWERLLKFKEGFESADALTRVHLSKRWNAGEFVAVPSVVKDNVTNLTPGRV